MVDSPLENYLYVIVALLPLSAGLLIFQTNPYNALVIRGILGAVAALVYAVLGAADVALTEALVGTLLAITLYAVAVRSSLVMRLGVLAEQLDTETEFHSITDVSLKTLTEALKTRLDQHHMRLELLPYDTVQALHQALAARAIHGMYTPPALTTGESSTLSSGEVAPPPLITLRVARLYEILKTELAPEAVKLAYVSVADGSALPTSAPKPEPPPREQPPEKQP
ncbi:MAG: DUF4040 domain-containing protein [Nodosilinea sp.]